jgi:hypothetical protein
MKKLTLLIVTLLISACSEEVTFTNSERSFDSNIWKSSPNQRYSMLEDFYKQSAMTLDSSEIIDKLGQPDAYYLYDEFPAYRLSESQDCLVAFVLDRSTKKVSEVLLEPEGCMD